MLSDAHKPAKQFSKTVKTAGCQCIYSRMMNSDNTSKKTVQWPIDLANMAKWLMDENQLASVTQELGRLFPSIKSRERKDESSELLMVGASASGTDTNNTSFATRSTTKRKIQELWGSKATSKC